jgi:hypothetical protein
LKTYIHSPVAADFRRPAESATVSFARIIARVLFVEPEVQRGELAPGLPGEQHLARHGELSDARYDTGKPARRHIGTGSLFS